jgi:hypothetical protein
MRKRFTHWWSGLRVVLFVLLALVICIELRQLRAEPDMAVEGSAVIATFPAPVLRLWPGGDGAFLAETRGHLYRWQPEAGVKELAVLGDDRWLPGTSLGWSPNRLAVVFTRRESTWPWHTELHVLFPPPERRLTLPSPAHVDLCEQAGLLFVSQPPPNNFDPAPPDAYRLSVLTLAGKPAPGWRETVNGGITTDFAQIDGKWRVALGNFTFDGAACRLLDERGSVRWKTDLPKEHELSAVKLSGSTGIVLVALKRFSTDTTGLWLLRARDGTIAARIGLPQDVIRGLHLSPNGRWAVAWCWYNLTLIDIAGRRIVWTGQVDDYPEDWRRIQGAEVADDGRVFAVHGHADSEGPVTLYAFASDGKPQPFWTSPQELNYDNAFGGRSIFLHPDGRRVFVRYGKEVIAVAVPTTAALPQTSAAQLPAHLARLSPELRRTARNALIEITGMSFDYDAPNGKPGGKQRKRGNDGVNRRKS